jgi:catechol 2,3-dioxygenase-like lactoylglutathione lyase family enzyme
MNPQISAITLGVKDIARARQFYAEGLGWPVGQDYPQWVSFPLAGGSQLLGLIERDTLAGDSGVDPAGDGFGGFTLSYLVRSEERVEEVLAEAEKAGATIVKPAEKAQWGGASGIFSDPDGYLWKVATGGGEQPFAE